MTAENAKARAIVQALAAAGEFEKALDALGNIDHPWYTAQAAAHIAHHAGDNDQICQKAMTRHTSEAARCDDEYQRAAVMAWGIAAAIKTGRNKVAESLLAKAMNHAANATPNESKAEALLLLLQAIFPLSARRRLEIAKAIIAIQHEPHGWRSDRAAVEAVAILRTASETEAHTIAALIPPGKVHRKAQRALQTPDKFGPRTFF